MPEAEVFEAILRKFACHAVFDVHVTRGAALEMIAQAAEFVRRYDCLHHVVLIAEDEQKETTLRECAMGIVVRSMSDFA